MRKLWHRGAIEPGMGVDIEAGEKHVKLRATEGRVSVGRGAQVRKERGGGGSAMPPR